MDIDVRFSGLESSGALRQHAMARVYVHLGRFGPHIERVTVFIEDENGPKGGVDKRCAVAVHGSRLGSATVTERGSDPYAIVVAALERTARTVSRRIDRSRHHTRASVRTGMAGRRSS